jgi:sulfite reductase beta subunit-like hemoprotein
MSAYEAIQWFEDTFDGLQSVSSDFFEVGLSRLLIMHEVQLALFIKMSGMVDYRILFPFIGLLLSDSRAPVWTAAHRFYRTHIPVGLLTKEQVNLIEKIAEKQANEYRPKYDNLERPR